MQVKGALWSPVSPTANQEQPYLVAYSSEMADELGLDPEDIKHEQFAGVFAGNTPIPGSATQPFAMRYGGHQFGTWAGRRAALFLPCCLLCRVWCMSQH